MANIVHESSQGFSLIPIDDEFLKDRKLFLTDSVSAETTNMLIKELMYLNKQDKKAEITLYINSPGGTVQDGLAAYDTIMLLDAPVRTVCIGLCASMGAILFLAGSKRQIMEHGRIMIHDPAFGHGYEMGGKKPHEIQSELDSLNRCREALAAIISTRTGRSLDEIYKATANDTYYSAEEAVEFGLATGIIRKKEAKNAV